MGVLQKRRLGLALVLGIACSTSFGSLEDSGLSVFLENSLHRVRGGNGTSLLDNTNDNEGPSADPLYASYIYDGFSRMSRVVMEQMKRGRETLSEMWRPLDERQRRFLEKIHIASHSLLSEPARLELPKVAEYEHEDSITSQSDLTRPGRHITIVTTAALPWMTGTAVNPLLRAAYLVRKTQEINQDSLQWVTLVIPWLELPNDQEQIYHRVFGSQQHQEQYIRDWLTHQANMSDAADPHTGLKIMYVEKTDEVN